MKRRVSGLEVVGAGVVAAVAIACGEAGMEHGGELMADAGVWMKDAGIVMADAGDEGEPGDRDGSVVADAGRMMMQMGGNMLADAGDMLRDTGTRMEDAGGADVLNDAQAQAACGTCTAGQRQMVVTADQDVQQLRGATFEGTGWTTARSAPVSVPAGSSACAGQDVEARVLTAKLADGPLVLTDVYASGSVNSQLFTVPVGSACHEAGPPVLVPVTCGNSTLISLPAPIRPLDSRSLFSTPDGFVLTGARVVITAGETLCATTGTVLGARAADPIQATANRLLWSGFAPYE